MPTYEYECEKCGKRLEKVQPITSEPLKDCPKCKKKTLRRVISSGGGIIFKGSGFYQTDYRSDSYKKSAEKEKPSSSAQGKPSDKASPERDSAAQGKPVKSPEPKKNK